MKRTEMKRATPLMARQPMARTEPAARKVRQRKCAVKDCRTPFTPRGITHKACSPDCALVLVDLDKERTSRKERQEGIAKLKRRADWVKEAQTAVNAYVRERDADKPCISCGRWHDGQWHAGHFLSTGARPGLRFVESNIHRQCMPCNVHLSGNLINYRIGLIKRIGPEAVEVLEYDDAPRKWSVDELKAIRDEYRGRLKALKRSRSEINRTDEHD